MNPEPGRYERPALPIELIPRMRAARLPRPHRPTKGDWPACIPTGAGEKRRKPGAASYGHSILRNSATKAGRLCAPCAEGGNRTHGTATRKNGTSFRRDICFAVRPLAPPHREWGRTGWGMPASPMVVGRARSEPNRRFPAVKQGVLPLNYAPVIGRRKGG